MWVAGWSAFMEIPQGYQGNCLHNGLNDTSHIRACKYMSLERYMHLSSMNCKYKMLLKVRECEAAGVGDKRDQPEKWVELYLAGVQSAAA